MDSALASAFLRWALVRAALARGWWLATAVYLVVAAHLSPTELVLIGVFQGLTVVVAEVPSGVLADAFGRRHALVVAHGVMVSGMALTGLVTGYPMIVLGQCLWGLGWAISSGADVAWITDELDRPDVIDRVLTAQGRYDLLGTPIGLVGFGTLAWATTLSTAIVGAGLGMVALGVGVVARWPESRSTSSVTDRRWQTMRSVFGEGVRVAGANRAVGQMLVATLLLNGGVQGFGRLFERHLIDLGLPDTPAPVTWFAGIGLASAMVGAATLLWIEGRIERDGVATAAYVAAAAIGAGGLMLFAHAPDTTWAIVGSILVRGMALPTTRVAATVVVNRCSPTSARATVHSLLSQAENLGEILFGLLLAAVATTTSATSTLTGSAVLLAAAAITVSCAVESTPQHAPRREHR